MAQFFGGMTAKEFNRTSDKKGWVVFIDTKFRRFAKKYSSDAHNYWRNFTYLFKDGGKNGTRKSTAPLVLQEAAAEVPEEHYWVPVFYKAEPPAEFFTNVKYREIVIRHKGSKNHTVESDLFEYRSKRQGISYYISVARGVTERDVYLRLQARVDSAITSAEIPTNIQAVRQRVMEALLGFRNEMLMVRHGFPVEQFFEVTKHTALKQKMLQDGNSGGSLARIMNLQALREAVARVPA